MLFYDRLYAFGIKVPQRQRYLLSLAVVSVLIGLWYMFIAMPLSQANSVAERALAQIKEQKAVLATTQTALEQTKQQATVQQQEIDAFVQKDQSVPVLTLLQQAGLDLSSYAPHPVIDNGWHTQTPITCDVTGSFAQIVAFVQACTQHKNLGITSCTLTKRDASIQCTCDVQMLTIKKEVGDEKK